MRIMTIVCDFCRRDKNQDFEPVKFDVPSEFGSPLDYIETTERGSVEFHEVCADCRISVAEAIRDKILKLRALE